MGELVDGLVSLVVSGHRETFKRATQPAPLQADTTAHIRDNAVAHCLTFSLPASRATNIAFSRSVLLLLPRSKCY